MVIGLLSAFYFYFIGLRILAFAELGFFIVMLYGYLWNKKRSDARELVFNVLLTCVSLVLSVALFNGALTVYQLISALSFIWGGYALATAKKALGWCLFLSAHIATSLASYQAGEVVFSGLQVLSGTVCIVALIGLLMRRRTQKLT